MSTYELGELLPYEQPSKYIVNSTEYDDSYPIPVLTAGKSFILGYTNETDNVFDELPVIIFDDFTTATQYVDFRFKVKSSAMKILHINTDIVYPKYIYYLLQTIHIEHSTHKRYWIQQFSKVKVAIPPIPEQEKIVSQIEESLSQLDSAVETLKKTKQQLEVYRQAVLKEAFEYKVTASKHRLIPLKELAPGKEGLRRGPFGGSIKKSCFVPSGYKVYEQGNAINDTIDYGKYFVTEEKYQEMASFKVRPHDLLVSCSGTLGRITELPDDAPPGIINQALLRIRLDRGIVETKYFIEYFRSENFQRKIVSKSQGSAMVNLVSIKEFKEVTMNVPDKEKQLEILNYLSERMSIYESIEQTINQSLQQAEALRQSILKRAFEED